MMTRQQATAAYERVESWERRQSEKLRKEILEPYFGSTTRLHNCIVNWETGRIETPDDPWEHCRLWALARDYNFRQHRIWNQSSRLKQSFARYF